MMVLSANGNGKMAMLSVLNVMGKEWDVPRSCEDICIYGKEWRENVSREYLECECCLLNTDLADKQK